VDDQNLANEQQLKLEILKVTSIEKNHRARGSRHPECAEKKLDSSPNSWSFEMKGVRDF
jgi:hypothetical protein